MSAPEFTDTSGTKIAAVISAGKFDDDGFVATEKVA